MRKVTTIRSLRESVAMLTSWLEATLEDSTPEVQGYSDEPDDLLHSLRDLDEPFAVLARLSKLDWSFTDDETAYLSHDIHPYPAKFIPQIPRQLITHLSLRGELVWDPFGGSGTTALEAILLGRRAVSTDVNPLSEIIGRAKTLTLTKEEETLISDFAEQLIILSSDPSAICDATTRWRVNYSAYVPPIPNIEQWFHQNAIDELAYLCWRIEQLPCPKCQTVARVCLSKSILKASYQDEETRYARRPREIAAGSVVRLFAGNLAIALRKVRELAPLLRFREADFRTLDLRDCCVGSTGCSLAGSSVDLIVTSPPYPNSNDYHLYHRFRLFWMGYDPREFGKREIGSHLRHQRESTGFESYLKELVACMRNMSDALRPGRYAVLVLGDAVFDGRAYNTAALIGKSASQVGLDFVGTIGRAVHETKRSFVSPGRRLRSEQLLVLRKPPCEMEFVLLKPPYKLWDYEDQIRRREADLLLGRHLNRAENGDLSSSLNPLHMDKLRRLTFTHGISSPCIGRESTWQAVLENGDAFKATSRRKDPKYATHGIHPYKGKFYPQLARCLFNLGLLEPGQKVLDPFCGSGTVLLEAYLHGLRGFGLDLNPLAVRISRAKTQILEVDPYLCDKLLARFQSRLTHMDGQGGCIDVFPEGTRSELLSWFPERVLLKLGWLLTEADQVPELRVREFLEVMVSSIVRQVSQQEPRDLRIRRRDVPLDDAPVRELFEERLQEQRTRLKYFAERSNRSPVRFLEASAIHGDSRDHAVYAANGLHRGSIDAVVTSPPYATALPYIDTDRLSILLLFGTSSDERNRLDMSLTGSREISKKSKTDIEARIDAEDFGLISSATARAVIAEVRRENLLSQVGFRKQNMAALLYRYFADMAVVVGNLDAALKPDGSAFFVIGDNSTVAGQQRVTIRSSKVLQETGNAVGWNLVDVIPISVTRENSVHAKNSITTNDILWFRKMS